MRSDPNREQLIAIAEALGELRSHVVFVGGATLGLLISDAAAPSVRPTGDIDAILPGGRADFSRMEGMLVERGFSPSIDGGVIGRWIHNATGGVFDLMPVDPAVFGFANRWYEFAVDTAEARELRPGMTIRVAGPIAILATKTEAFWDRGARDLTASHDLEDILSLVDGRDELLDELVGAPEDVRQFISDSFDRLLNHEHFIDVLPGIVLEPERATSVVQRMRRMLEWRATT